MWIKKINIKKYGPVENLDLDISRGLQVIWGRNETGKTLTIDAIIKIFLEGKTKNFDSINRVEEDPEGFILLEDGSGGEIKINIRKGLSSHMNFDNYDLRNLFIIRDSDLRLKEECSYYKNITDKLTGLQSSRIEKIISCLKDYGRLTTGSSGSSASLANNRENNKVASVYQGASEFIKEASDYIDSSVKSRSDYLELELIKIREKIKDEKSVIKNLEEASRWIKYEKFGMAIKTLEEKFETYNSLEEISEKTYGDLLDLKAEFDALQREVEKSKFNIREIKQKSSRLAEEKNMLGAKLKPMELKKEIISRLTGNMDSYSRRKEEKSPPLNRKFYVTLMFVLLILAIASFPAIYLPSGNISISIIFSAIFLSAAAAVFFIIRKRESTPDKYKLEASEIREDFKKIGFKINDFEDIYLEINRFEENYQELKESIRLIEQDISLCSHKENEYKSGLEEMELRQSVIEKKLLDIFNKSGVKSIQDFSKKINLRNKVESEINALAKSMLSDVTIGIVPEDESYADESLPSERHFIDNPQRMLADLRKSLERLEPAGIEEHNKAIEFDESKYEKLKNSLESDTGREKELEILLEEHKNILNGFNRVFLELGLSIFLEDFTEINIITLDRLKEAVETAGRFIEKTDTEFNVAVESIKIFEEIRREEETKISNLFEELNVSGYFKDITDGYYTKVEFNRELESVVVVNKEGSSLPAQKLSKGAYDQLFLCIRLAIAEKLFGEQKGFFIMDDAFLASDEFRLRKQFKILKDLADNGWSIIYFSVKNEIKDIARDYSNNKIITI